MTLFALSPCDQRRGTAAEAGRRVYYGTLAGLIELLMEAKQAGTVEARS